MSWLFVLVANAGLVLHIRRGAKRQVRIAQREERIRIARELHDGLVQDIQALILGIDNARRGHSAQRDAALDHLVIAAEASLDEARARIEHLRTPLADGPLADVLGRRLGEWMQTTGLDMQLCVSGEVRKVSPDVTAELLLIAQECVSNAAAHAGATLVTAHLAFGPRSLMLTVTDDGCGMSPGAARGETPGRFGLRGMRERAELIGGVLFVESSPNGTTVGVQVRARDAYAGRWTALLKRFPNRRE